MNTKVRIAAIRLIGQMEKQPEYAKRVGVSIHVNNKNTSCASKKGVIIWESEKSEAIVR